MPKHCSLHNYYTDRLNTYGPTHKAVGWRTRERQEKRFEVIEQHIPNNTKTLLDIGCGLGDFYHYLKLKGRNIAYTGIDAHENMIHHAKTAYPNAIFIQSPWQIYTPKHPFDCIVASGLFNGEKESNPSYIISALDKFSSWSPRIIFNTLKKPKTTVKKPSPLAYINDKDLEESLKNKKIPYKKIDLYLENDVTWVITNQDISIHKIHDNGR